MQHRKITNYLWAGLTLLALLLIFHNSMYPIIQSDQQSGAVLDVLNRFFRANGFPVILTQFDVRKLAHFIEYFIFGFLFTAAIRKIQKKWNGSLFFELFFFLIFPITDETIQLRYAGRGSSVRDVLIDFVGCVIGMEIYRLAGKNSEETAGLFSLSASRIKPVATPQERSERQIFAIVTVLFVLFIFQNSMFPGPQSSRQSQYVMNLLNHMLSALRIPVTLSEHCIRKAGHFTEYFIFGILIRMTVKLSRKPFWSSVFAVLFFLLLVPVIDEFIQFFTPQRGSSLLDVLLDFSGGIAGTILVAMGRKRKSQT